MEALAAASNILKNHDYVLFNLVKSLRLNRPVRRVPLSEFTLLTKMIIICGSRYVISIKQEEGCIAKSEKRKNKGPPRVHRTAHIYAHLKSTRLRAAGFVT